jgi:hypothetical protein
MKKRTSIVVASTLAIFACAGTSVKECNSIHTRERAYGDRAIAALGRCLKKSTTSVECKDAMDVLEKYTKLSTSSTECAEANRLKNNLRYSQLQLSMVTEKLDELEKRSRSEQKAIRKARKGNGYGF